MPVAVQPVEPEEEAVMGRMDMNDACDDIINRRYAHPGLSDDARNQLAELADEGDDPDDDD